MFKQFEYKGFTVTADRTAKSYRRINIEVVKHYTYLSIRQKINWETNIWSKADFRCESEGRFSLEDLNKLKAAIDLAEEIAPQMEEIFNGTWFEKFNQFKPIEDRLQ